MIYLIKKNQTTIINYPSPEVNTFIDKIVDYENYFFGHYYLYPSKYKNGWRKHMKSQLIKFLKDKENILFFTESLDEKKTPLLLVFRASEWDQRVFGFRITTSLLNFLPNDDMVTEGFKFFIRRSIEILKSHKIRLISLRLHGDNLKAIHASQECGFLYFENIIWTILECDKLAVPHKISKGINIRIAKERDIKRTMYIAKNFQYKRGHYHCDEGIGIEKANLIYPKWINSAWKRKDPIILIEYDREIAGYFILKILGDEYQKSYGYKYGGLRSLALDPKFRGHGLGKTLFNRSLWFLKDNGVDVIDSGYASKNHVSAHLHIHNNFYSVYEEVTMHLWL
jgi:GNAT superfamily N-acetyltransferase